MTVPQLFGLLPKLAPRSQMSFEKLSAFLHLLLAHKAMRPVEGALVECGAWKGASAALMGAVWPECAIHLYDSFEGMPAPTESDFTRGDTSVNGRILGDGGTLGAGGLKDTSVDAAKRSLAMAGVINFVIHKGFITAQGLLASPERIAVLHIDLDFYDPYKIALASLYAKVVHGGLIVFDDYGHFIGAKRAVDEFIGSTGESLRQADPTSRRFVVKGAK